MIWFFLLELGNLIFGSENQAWHSILFSSSVFFIVPLPLATLMQNANTITGYFLQVGYLLFRWSSRRSCSAAKNQRTCQQFVGSTPGRLVIAK